MQALSGEADGRAFGEGHPCCAVLRHVRAPLSVWKQITEVWGDASSETHPTGHVCRARELLRAANAPARIPAPAATGDLDPATSDTVVSCSLVVFILSVTPWRFVWDIYVRAPGDRWR